MRELRDRVSHQDRLKLADAIIGMMGSETDPVNTARFGDALDALDVGSVRSKTAAAAARSILKGMEAPNGNDEEVGDLAYALSFLGANLTLDELHDYAEDLVAPLSTDSIGQDELRRICEQLKRLDRELPAEPAADGVQAIIKRLRQEDLEPFELEILCIGLRGLRRHLSIESALNAVEAVRAVRTGLTKRRKALPQEHAHTIRSTVNELDHMVPAVVAELGESPAETARLGELAEKMLSLGEWLPPRSVAAIATALGKTAEKPNLGELVQAATDKMANRGFDAGELATVGDAFASIRSVLSDLQPRALLSTSRAILREMTDDRIALAPGPSATLPTLAKTLLTLCDGNDHHIDNSFIEAATNQLVFAMRRETLRSRSDESKETTESWATLERLLANLTSKQNVADVLKNPFCYGRSQELALAELEARTGAGVNFGHDIFACVNGQKELGLDMTSPPSRPAVTESNLIDQMLRRWVNAANSDTMEQVEFYTDPVNENGLLKDKQTKRSGLRRFFHNHPNREFTYLGIERLGPLSFKVHQRFRNGEVTKDISDDVDIEFVNGSPKISAIRRRN